MGDVAQPHELGRSGQVHRPTAHGRTRLGLISLVTLVVTLGTAACGAGLSEEGSVHGPSTSPTMSMSPGMTMPASSQAAGAPSVSARMICSAEIQGDVATILALPTPPTSKTSWENDLYTCAYQLPGGHLVLSVKDAGDRASAQAYFGSLSHSLGSTTKLTGMFALGLPAFEAAGVVVFLKDDKTLEVDASDLPGEVGPDRQTPTDLAYTVASDVLGCWSGA